MRILLHQAPVELYHSYQHVNSKLSTLASPGRKCARCPDEPFPKSPITRELGRFCNLLHPPCQYCWLMAVPAPTGPPLNASLARPRPRQTLQAPGASSGTALPLASSSSNCKQQQRRRRRRTRVRQSSRAAASWRRRAGAPARLPRGCSIASWRAAGAAFPPRPATAAAPATPADPQVGRGRAPG